MKRISKRVREEAAWVLDVAADVNGIGEASFALGVSDHDLNLQRFVYGDAHRLAMAARMAVGCLLRGPSDYADECMEAAALLRDGWNPGDPVVRR